MGQAPDAQQRLDSWQGVVEWQEKSKNPAEPNNKITHSLMCNVSVNHGEPRVNASQWPNSLKILLMPTEEIRSQKDMLHNSRRVVFTFGNNRIVHKRFYQVMANGYAGCMLFPNQTQCDLRVLMLLYSSRKKQFMGFIPNEQAAFVNRIREIITKRRQATHQTLMNQASVQQQQQQQQQQQPI